MLQTFMKWFVCKVKNLGVFLFQVILNVEEREFRRKINIQENKLNREQRKRIYTNNQLMKYNYMKNSLIPFFRKRSTRFIFNMRINEWVWFSVQRGSVSFSPSYVIIYIIFKNESKWIKMIHHPHSQIHRTFYPAKIIRFDKNECWIECFWW